MGFLIASRFFALLAVATNVLVIGVLVAWLSSGRSTWVTALRSRLAVTPARSLLALAWLVATVATLGSLYYSEIVGLPPCELCWYQRIAMYPLAVILGVAAWREDRDIAVYAVPIAAVGAAIATYHYALEWVPALDVGACAQDVPCSIAWFRAFGFVSLPYMALSGFLAVIALTVLARRRASPVPDDPAGDVAPIDDAAHDDVAHDDVPQDEIPEDDVPQEVRA